MKIRCIDTETTGMPSDQERAHALVEVGWCDLTDDFVGNPHGELVNPGRPIPIPARAVHHISDEDVADAISPTEACMILNDGDHEFVCAHNVDFEKLFVGIGERQWICTYKSALRVWPEAPGHKLAELMYFLEVDKDPDFFKGLAQPLHRAAPDAYVCAFVLRRMLREASLKDILKWSSGPALLHMCFMKKHANKPWSQVAQDDPEYMLWIVNKSDVKDKDIRATCRYWLRLKGHIT